MKFGILLPQSIGLDKLLFNLPILAHVRTSVSEWKRIKFYMIHLDYKEHLAHQKFQFSEEDFSTKT